MTTAGEVLKKQRENLNKSIEQVSLDTKIQPRFIRYIESNSLNKFDSPIYAQGFIKIYSKYLNLNEERILAIYRRSVPETNNKTSPLRETGKNLKKLKIRPKAITVSLSAFFLLGILFYISYQIYQFQNPPKITITAPENNSTVTEDSIEIIGITDKNASLFINDESIDLDSQGNFEYSVSLNPGVNLITLSAKKNNGTQESIETIKITYTAVQENQEEPSKQKKQVNIVKLEIINSSVWIQLNVDSVNEISQIVQSGQKYEYEVEKEFSLTTGIINSTKIYFNNEELTINSNSSNVGFLDCEISDDNQIDCE